MDLLSRCDLPTTDNADRETRGLVLETPGRLAAGKARCGCDEHLLLPAAL